VRIYLDPEAALLQQWKACELEDCICSYMKEVSHLRPDRLNLVGRFYVVNVQHQSIPLALTQLIILYHVMCARKRMQRGEYVVRPQLKLIFGDKTSCERM
jgi:hypothetical protein